MRGILKWWFVDYFRYWIRGKPAFCTYCGKTLFFEGKAADYDSATGNIVTIWMKFYCTEGTKERDTLHDKYIWKEFASEIPELKK